MTIKRRLFWSNVLMITVPVVAAVIAGLLCLGVVLTAVISGPGLSLNDAEDFNRIAIIISESFEEAPKTDRGFSSIEPLLKKYGMTAVVCCQGEEIFSFGEEKDEDRLLLQSLSALSGNSMLISQSGRSVYKSEETEKGVDYTIYIFGADDLKSHYIDLKVAIITSAVVIAVTVVLSVVITNRFLTMFVFRHIEEPLDILTAGVHKIRDGELDCRIEYTNPDEFRQVCEDFNEMAARLKTSVARQRREEQSRRELFAGISHDIRSPLTSIRAYVEGLLDGIAKTPEMQKKYLSTIKTKAEELDHMVSQLFLFSKTELGEYSDNNCSLCLDSKIETIVSDSRTEFEEKGMKIETELVPTSVFADPIQLDRVFSNIMGNSLKYMDKDSGVLKITLTNTGDSCTVAFDDDGPGVPDEAMPHLFEVFYRSDPARHHPQKGSGLGLAIAESIVTHWDGSIKAMKSSLGGLRIEICLPCVQGDNENGKNTDN